MDETSSPAVLTVGVGYTMRQENAVDDHSAGTERPVDESGLDLKREQIRLRQEKERQLYDKWLAAKEADKEIRQKQVEQNAIDARTRSILLKLKSQDHFGLRLVRQVSSNEKATVFLATGENDMNFAFKIFHSGKQPAKKEFARLLELEKMGAQNVPSPVLFRGHVLVTKWMDQEEGSHEELQQRLAEDSVTVDPSQTVARRRDLSPTSKKAQKKAVKEAQAENRRNAHLKELHLTGISERKIISKRLYGTKKGETMVGDDAERLPIF